jgi:Sulfotransferase family
MNPTGRRALPSPLGLARRRRRETVPAGWSPAAPDFVGVGAQRSGTTWWHGLIGDHPRVENRWKELHFFDGYFARELADADIAEYHSLCARPAGKLAGEWTPRYMADFWAPALIRRAAPDARILVLLRDPLERFRSGLRHELGRFVQEVPRRRRQYAGALSASSALSRSLYTWQLRNLFREFDRDRVLILQYERCVEDPEGQLRRTFEFLEAEPFDHVPEFLRRRAGRPQPGTGESEMAIEAALRLIRDDVAELATLTPELDLDLWPSCRPGDRAGA